MYITLPKVSESDWYTLATIPEKFNETIFFPAYLYSSLNASSFTIRDAAINFNGEIRMFFGANDVGKNFKTVITTITK